jgi:hypothetical protein
LADTAPSADELQALRNLSRKQNGEEVDFINIADARALTERGLAVRTQQGWVITDAGASLLQNGDSDQPSETPPAVLTPFNPKLV